MKPIGLASKTKCCTACRHSIPPCRGIEAQKVQKEIADQLAGQLDRGNELIVKFDAEPFDDSDKWLDAPFTEEEQAALKNAMGDAVDL